MKEAKQDRSSGQLLEQKEQRTHFLPLPLGATEEELEDLSKYMRAIAKLSDRCLCHFLTVRNRLEYQLERQLTNQELLHALDDGHSAWFVMRCETKENLQWDMNRRFQECESWYLEWKPWFEEHNPNYFLKVKEGEEK